MIYPVFNNVIKAVLLQCCMLVVSILYAQSPTDEWRMELLGKTIYNGLLTGNGLLGTTTYLMSDSVVRVDIGRTDVYDHRADIENKLFTKARLPIGHFLVHFDTPVSVSGKMLLSDANATAAIRTTAGTCYITTTTLSERNIILIEMDKANFTGTSHFSFVPEISQSPRAGFYLSQFPSYKPNPAAVPGKAGEVIFVNQPMTAGGGYCTAYKLISSGERKEVYAVTISYAIAGSNYVRDAINTVKAFSPSAMAGEIVKHRSWWSQYRALSSYKIPDPELQQFYDMQLYKIACATRADKPAIDLQGPWTASTPWPAYWLNLNIQLTYDFFYTANRLSLAESFLRLVDKNRSNLSLNVPEPLRENCIAVGRSAAPDLASPIPIGANGNISTTAAVEISNLTWMLYYYYKHYRYSMDERLKNPLIDLLTRSTNFAINYLKKTTEGRYAFSIRSHSPEYPGSFDFNTNYDLSCLQWGLKTLLEMTATDPGFEQQRKRWKDIQTNLIDYPKDENGFMISSNQPYSVSHRHYSHLLMIYPFCLINYDQPENRTFIQQSLAYWHSKKGAMQGYSLSGAASIFALMKNGDSAVVYLKQLLKRYIRPNSLYAESGPVIETPLSAAGSLQELSLQHWNGVTRVFPAIPSYWKDVSFTNFRTDGAFLVSGYRENSINKRVTVYSEKGGVLAIDSNIELAAVLTKKKCFVMEQQGSIYKVKMEKGGFIEFHKK